VYHSIPASDDTVGYFAVSRAGFAAQLDRLVALGMTGVSVEAALLRGNTTTPGVAAISFDDGYANNFTEAFPELLARGMSATFFVITSRIGTPGYVTWEQLRAMRASGMSIQSHTHTHPYLSSLSTSAAREELETSRRLLDEALGQTTTTLALPNGDAPRGWKAADFAEAGVRFVATSAFGWNSAAPTWRVRRYTVRRETTLPQFEQMVRALPSAWSREGLRLGFLAVVRSLLGTTRYARWRRRVLRTAGR
jgi:peptidoglycan/xylan/chitin deacetylase (PgdA/CDA1 family)